MPTPRTATTTSPEVTMSQRRLRTLVLLTSLFAAGLAAGTRAAGAAEWKWTPELVADTTRLQEAQIAPDGRRIVYAATRPRADGAPFGASWVNLWLVDAAGGAARRLTSADAEDKSPAWSGDGRAIGFLSSRGGEKAKTRLYVIAPDGGEARALTSEKSDVESFAWSRDGRRIAYLAIDPKSDEREKAEKAGKDWKVVDRDDRPRRLWIVDLPSAGGPGADLPAARPVKALGERSAWNFAWAPDGRALVATVTDTPHTDDSYMKKRIEILPLADDGRGRPIAGVVGKVDEVLWSRDGKTIVWRGGVDQSDPTTGSIFALEAGAPAGSTPVNLTAGRPETVRDLLWADGFAVVAVAVQGTRTAIVAHDLRDRAARRTLLEGGRLVFDDASASDDGTRFAFGGSTADGPEDVYAAKTSIEPKSRASAGGGKSAAAAAGSLETTRLTDLNPQVAGLPRGRQEVIRYKASDGQEIEGVLIAPSDLQRPSYPLVVIVHGGPEYEFHDGWVTRVSEPAQPLAERGYYVFLPNYRGSAGRGVAFAKGDHNDLGGREFQDVLDGIDWMVEHRRVDRARVGMTGGSYGGYFTSLAVTRYSDRFAAGVALFGISNWMSFLGQSDIPAENSLVHWNLWCYEHKETCANASPVEHIDKAHTPTLVFQGEEDKRVPKPQSDELYAALKWKGVPAEYVVFPREKHGFVEREHQIETMRRTLDWFEKYLKP
jgi:dipeptidyl aminopeptidase/acylaminoacyl peptidase